ncbi:MAG: ankyrin repeat domain-containing protein [Myxococcota bacterium]
MAATVAVLVALGVGCDSAARRAAEEEAIRAEPPVQTGNLGDAMGARERVMPKLPTPQDRFMWAVREGDRTEAQRWLDKGAVVGRLDGGDAEVTGGATQTGAAILVAGVRGKGDLAFVTWLVERGASIDEVDDAGRTPLSWAASEGDVDLVEFFVERGADVHRADRLGRIPLHYAVFSSDAGVVDALLKSNSNINAQDSLGSTALMYACGKNLPEVVAILERAGADKTLRDNLGRTIVERAHGDNNPCVQSSTIPADTD